MTPPTATPNAAYRESAVLSAPPEVLVVMLYDGARRFLFQAGVAMRDGQIELSHRKLRRAEDIIRHLLDALDMDQGEISERLESIYPSACATSSRPVSTAMRTSSTRSATCSASFARRGRPSRANESAETAPYEVLARMIERELELVGDGDYDALAELKSERDALIATLRRLRPPPRALRCSERR